MPFADFIFDKKTSLEEIRNKYYSDIPEETFYFLMNTDPTYVNGSDRMGEFGKQILEWYKKNPNAITTSGPDSREVWKSLLEDLLDLRRYHLLPEGFQINKIKTRQELASMIIPEKMAAVIAGKYDPSPEGVFLPFLTRMIAAHPSFFTRKGENVRITGVYGWKRLLQYYMDLKLSFSLDDIAEFIDFKFAVYQALVSAEGEDKHHTIWAEANGELLSQTRSKFAAEVFGYGAKWCTTWEVDSYYNKNYASDDSVLAQVMHFPGDLLGAIKQEEKVQFFCDYHGDSIEIENQIKDTISLDEFVSSMSGSTKRAFEEMLQENTRVPNLYTLLDRNNEDEGDGYGAEEEERLDYFDVVRRGENSISFRLGTTDSDGDINITDSFPVSLETDPDQIIKLAVGEPWEGLNLSPISEGVVYVNFYPYEANGFFPTEILDMVRDSDNTTEMENSVNAFKELLQESVVIWKNPVSAEDGLSPKEAANRYAYIFEDMGRLVSVDGSDDVYFVMGEAPEFASLPYFLYVMGGSFEEIPDEFKKYQLSEDLPPSAGIYNIFETALEDGWGEFKVGDIPPIGFERVNIPVGFSLGGSPPIPLYTIGVHSEVEGEEVPDTETLPLFSAEKAPKRKILYVDTLVSSGFASGYAKSIDKPLTIFLGKIFYWISRDYEEVRLSRTNRDLAAYLDATPGLSGKANLHFYFAWRVVDPNFSGIPYSLDLNMLESPDIKAYITKLRGILKKYKERYGERAFEEAISQQGSFQALLSDFIYAYLYRRFHVREEPSLLSPKRWKRFLLEVQALLDLSESDMEKMVPFLQASEDPSLPEVDSF